jgi:hypothetical protein
VTAQSWRDFFLRPSLKSWTPAARSTVSTKCVSTVPLVVVAYQG